MLEEQNNIMQSLKWKELSEIEEYVGTPMDEWAESGNKTKLAFATYYIIAKKKNPELTMEAAENLTVQQLIELAGVEFSLPKEAKPA